MDIQRYSGDGIYNIRTEATDAAGNTTPGPGIQGPVTSFTVDRTAP